MGGIHHYLVICRFIVKRWCFARGTDFQNRDFPPESRKHRPRLTHFKISGEFSLISQLLNFTWAYAGLLAWLFVGSTHSFDLVQNYYNYRPQTKLREGYVFTGVCDSVHSGGGGWYPRMPCRSHDQPALYKQLHCWWVSVGEEAAYR